MRSAISADHLFRIAQSKSSKAYNANVRRMCVKLMLEYVKSPPFPCE